MKRSLWFGMLMFIAIFSFCGLSFASDGAPAATPAPSMANLILHGVLAGAVASLVGFLGAKNDDGSHEAFDLKKFGLTLLIGAGAGAFCGWKGIPLDSAMGFLQASPFVMFADQLLKKLWANGPSVSAAVKAFSAGKANPTPDSPAPTK